jgi:hypothetical protein
VSAGRARPRLDRRAHAPLVRGEPCERACRRGGCVCSWGSSVSTVVARPRTGAAERASDGAMLVVMQRFPATHTIPLRSAEVAETGAATREPHGRELTSEQRSSRECTINLHPSRVAEAPRGFR